MAVRISPSDLESLRKNLKQRESSGNYQAVNSLGYAGAYQFGALALVDTGQMSLEKYKAAKASGTYSQKSFMNNPDNWNTAGGLPGFLNNQAQQDQAFERLVGINLNRLERQGVIDETTNPADVNGYLAVSHLLGSGGAEDFSKGSNGTDANGTKASEYYELGQRSSTGAGGAPAAPELTPEEKVAELGLPPGTEISADGTQAITPEGEVIDLPAPGVEDSVDPSAGTDTEVSAGAGRKAGGKAGAFEESLDNITVEPRSNPLANMSNVTYNLALYQMGVGSYIELMKAKGPEPMDRVNSIQRLLIARSGGLGADISKEFDIDFFIDNLEMTNVGSPNKAGANTNSTDISFDIFEPRGITLIERLKTASDELGEDTNYINCPYLLEIRFLGYDDSGAEMKPPVPTRYLPIKITELKFGITASGAAYRINAVPFHQNVFGAVNNTIPINVQVSAQTAGEVFTNKVEILEEINDVEDGGDNVTTYKPTGESARTLSEAINKFYKKTTEPKKGAPAEAEHTDAFDFLLGSSIANSKLIQNFFDALNTNMKDSGDAFKTYAGAVNGKINLDSDSGMFRIEAGTSIVALINFIVIASEYMDRNVAAEGAAQGIEGENVPVYWWKIKPKLLDVTPWDTKAGRYKYSIRYDVIPTTMYYNDYPWGPISKPRGEGYHKLYNYIFTGENTEILNIKLDLNTAYYQTQTFGTGTPDNAIQDINGTTSTIRSVTTEQANENSDDAGSAPATIQNLRGKDLVGTIMSDGADLVELKMDILGDPDYIPTGDGFFQGDERSGKLYTEPYWPDGTINYDLTAPHVNIVFNTPTEYNDTSGLLDVSVDKRYGSSAFSGIYRVIEVKSKMSGGVFTQSLELIRSRVQPDADGKMQGATFAESIDPGSGVAMEDAEITEDTPLGVRDSGAARRRSLGIGVSGDSRLRTEESLPNQDLEGDQPAPLQELVEDIVNLVEERDAAAEFGIAGPGGEFDVAPRNDGGLFGTGLFSNEIPPVTYDQQIEEAVGAATQRIDQNQAAIDRNRNTIAKLEEDIEGAPESTGNEEVDAENLRLNDLRREEIQRLKNSNQQLRARNKILNDGVTEATGYPTTPQESAANVGTLDQPANEYEGANVPKPNTDSDLKMGLDNPDVSREKADSVAEYRKLSTETPAPAADLQGIETRIKRIDPDFNAQEVTPDLAFQKTSANPNAGYEGAANPSQRSAYEINQDLTRAAAERELAVRKAQGEKVQINVLQDGTHVVSKSPTGDTGF